MKKMVGIDELAVGMYVARITKSKGSATMVSQGLLKNESSITNLKKLKVLEVEIDTSKSVSQNDEDKSVPTPTKTSETADNLTPTPMSKEIRRAKEIYARAREIQREAFDKTKSNGTLDIEAYREVSTEFFDSIYRNQDALLCMTRLQDKDSYLLEHSINVAILMGIFAKYLGLNKDLGLKLTLAGLLHDIGKAKVPDEVLFKPGKLTHKELDEIKKHPEYGASILRESGMDGLTVQIALQHHERLSGSGYPLGLIDHQLNRYVRMSCIADVFDAITAERIYKPGMTAFQAIKIIKGGSDTEYDGKLLQQFVQAIGLFSIGTVVLMASQKLAIVTKTNHENPLKPHVTTFYHTKFNRHIENTVLDLDAKKVNDSIEKMVNAADYDIDINALINRFIID